jgi:hypothetical protein
LQNAPFSRASDALAVDRLQRRSWPVKFEGQFKVRDERAVNAVFPFRAGGIRDVPISRGFFVCLRNRFTLTFREPITIAATGHTKGGKLLPALQQAGSTAGRARDFWKKGPPGFKRTGLERGRRRTRQDQISLKALRR